HEHPALARSRPAAYVDLRRVGGEPGALRREIRPAHRRGLVGGVWRTIRGERHQQRGRVRRSPVAADAATAARAAKLLPLRSRSVPYGEKGFPALRGRDELQPGDDDAAVAVDRDVGLVAAAGLTEILPLD